MSEDFLARYMVLAALASMKSAAPPLIVAAVVGFIVALFQGVTQIQDQSLPLTLKILAVGAIFLAFGATLAQPVIQLADEALRIFPSATRQPRGGGAMLELLNFVMPVIQAAALVIARPLGFLLIFPLFTWLGLQGMIRNVIALAIGLPMIGPIYADLAVNAAPLPVEYVVLLAGKEFLVGATLAIVFGVPFWAAEMAGAYVDVYRGSSVATVVSPTQMADPLISGAIFSIALVAIFLAAGGLRTVIGAIYESFDIWPLFEMMPNISANLYPVFVDLLTTVARIGLALGAPILIAMFIGELCLAFASRFAPQINIFDAMLSIKNIIFLVMLPPYLHFLTLHFGPNVLNMDELTRILRGLAGQ